MKNYLSYIKKGIITMTLGLLVFPAGAAEITGWGDFKLYLDPGHAKKENGGLYSYSEAEKTLRVAWAVRDYLKKYTDIPAENIKLCRETDEDFIDLTERVDVANAWGADFYYSLHSDAGDSNTPNTTLTMFGGWKKDGVEIEKEPNGGKAFGEILCPNLTGVMQIETRGNWYDRSYYDKGSTTHTNQYPYLAVNRRSNMASLLSEAGFHTNAFQQQRNLNENYKKLEGYAAFRSILQYRGLANPVQPLLVGVIRNSENNVPVNGITVSVGDQTLTTDTYESLFNKYSKDPNMLHNGFYMFEDLTAGQEYTVTFTAPDYTTVEKKITIVSKPEGSAAENITWLDVQMTSSAPAKIDQISITDPTAVVRRTPIVLTFSRNMDRASVESAFSISGGVTAPLSWSNDYTLSVDLGNLEYGKSYQIKIDGNVAKNSQTQQFFDGDGNGTEGGDYVLDFTIEPLDETAPTIVSTDPAVDGESTATYRPVIRIEFDEEVAWNEDKYINLIKVFDADDNIHAGKISHTVINGTSVIHYKFDEDLPIDKCIKVEVGSIEDFNGNKSEPYAWKFLTEYRPVSSEIIVQSLDSESGWWAPAGSGSSEGLVSDANFWTKSSDTYSSTSAGSCKLTYAFDNMATTALWQIRQYCSSAAGKVVSENIDGVLKFWLYGDGSNNKVSVMVRANKSSGGLKHPVMTPVSFRGWKQIVWDMKNDTYEAFTGEDELTGTWMLDSFFITHENTDGNPDVPQQAWDGMMLFDDLVYTIYDNSASRTASLDDIEGSSVGSIGAGLYIYRSGEVLRVDGQGAMQIGVFNISGQLIASGNATDSFEFNMEACPNGIYLVKVATEQGNITKKIVK